MKIDRWFTLKFIPIYDVLVHVLRWNPPELPRTISSISSVPIYTVTSSFVGALITVVCGPTWTNQWKVRCRSHVIFCVNRRCARGGVELGCTKVGQRRVRWSGSWFLLVFMLAYLMVQTCITWERQRTFHWFVQVGPHTIVISAPTKLEVTVYIGT